MGWSKDPGPPSAGKTPAFCVGERMKELSVFVDESDDFGEYDRRSPFYIISLVLHDQSIDISEDLKALEREMVLFFHRHLNIGRIGTNSVFTGF